MTTKAACSAVQLDRTLVGWWGVSRAGPRADYLVPLQAVMTARVTAAHWAYEWAQRRDCEWDHRRAGWKARNWAALWDVTLVAPTDSHSAVQRV